MVQEYETRAIRLAETQALLDKPFALIGPAVRRSRSPHAELAYIDENNSDALRWSEARLHMNLDWPFGFTEYHGSTQVRPRRARPAARLHSICPTRAERDSRSADRQALAAIDAARRARY